MDLPHKNPDEEILTADRWLCRLFLGGTLLLLLVLARPLIFGGVYAYDDLGAFHLPVRLFYHSALIHGGSFLWSPSFFNGFYLHGEGQAGMCHPLHLLLYRLLSLEGAFNLEFILSYILLFPGLIVLLRRLELPPPAALCGAFLFTFSGFTLLHSMHLNAIAITAHIPWLLAAIDELLRTKNVRRLAYAHMAISLLTGSQLLLGYPQYVWFSLAAEGAFILLRWPQRVSTQRLCLVLTSHLFGLMLGAVQLWPTLETLWSSVRHRPTLNFRLAGSLHPLNLMQFWAPYSIRNRVYGIAAEEGIYNGAFCTIAPIWLLMRRRSLGPGRELAAPLTAFAVVILLFALGRYGVVYQFIAQQPVLNLFRFPARYIVLLHLDLAILAAVALADLMRMRNSADILPWTPLWPLALPFGLCAITVAAATASRIIWKSDLFATFPYAVFSLLLVGSCGLLVALAARGCRWSLPLLAVLTVMDLAAWGLRYPLVFPPRSVSEVAAAFPDPAGAHPGARLTPPSGIPNTNALILAGYRLTAGYVALTPQQPLDFNGINARRIAGVSWRWINGRWEPSPSPLPRARLLTQARVASGDISEIERIDPVRMALIDRRLELPSGVPGAAHLLMDQPGQVDIESDAATSQILVLSESYHPGWEATLDGHAVPVLRVYSSFLGCQVLPGRHRIRFQFQPASFQRGALVSLCSLGLMLGYTLFIVTLRRPDRRETPC